MRIFRMTFGDDECRNREVAVPVAGWQLIWESGSDKDSSLAERIPDLQHVKMKMI